jgi:hypothetical protein
MDGDDVTIGTTLGALGILSTLTDSIYSSNGNMLLLALVQTANGYQGTISIGMVL